MLNRYFFTFIDFRWLLEVNSRPALESTDEEDHDLKYNMISDVLNVVDFEGRWVFASIIILWNIIVC